MEQNQFLLLSPVALPVLVVGLVLPVDHVLYVYPVPSACLVLCLVPFAVVACQKNPTLEEEVNEDLEGFDDHARGGPRE